MKKIGLLVMVLVFQASGKSLDSRFGFGMATTNYNSMAALSLKYHFDHFLSTTVQMAFDTSDSRNSTVFGGKIHRNVSMEENINFYLGAGLFLVADKGGTSTLSGGIELEGLIGMEFFLSGLPSLGISLETGLALSSVRTVSFSTMGSAFGGAGVHYYF